MGKIRSVDVKPKKTADFKKKTARVGKKVVRSNVTKINIKSKRIFVPVQTINNTVSPADEVAAIDSTLKLLQHYNPKNRLLALVSLQEQFCKNTRSGRHLGRIQNIYVLYMLVCSRVYELCFCFLSFLIKITFTIQQELRYLVP